MKFVERFSKFWGMISVREIGSEVKVTGVDGEILRRHLALLFESDAIAKKMFSTITDTSFSFNKFFIPDVMYMLAKLRHSDKATWSGKRMIDKIVSGMLNNTWFKCSVGEVQSIIDMKQVRSMKWTPMPKQVEFLELFGDKLPRYNLKGYIIALAPGKGKTFSALLVSECVIPPSVAEVKIIISPKKALHLVWEKTLGAVFKKVPTYWTAASGETMPINNTEYYIFNFEQIDKAIDLAKKLAAKNVKYFVMVDESHNFADFRSARTQKLVNLQTQKNCTYFLWISGSPILKSASELISFLKCSDSTFDADAERRFKQIFTTAPGRANEIFNHRLGQMMAFVVGKDESDGVRPTIKELPVKLPPMLAKRFLMSSVREEMRDYVKDRLEFYKDHIKSFRKIVDNALQYHENRLETREERKAFYEYQKNLRVILGAPDLVLPDILAKAKVYEQSKLIPSLHPMARREFRNALSATKNLKLKVRGEALGTILAKRRAECAGYLGLYCKPDLIMKQSLSKTMFFSSSVLPVKMVGKFLENKGFEPVLVYADTNADLTRNIERFTNDPDVNPICATMRSLSEAVPVIAASTVVLLNRPFRDGISAQVIARADRLGQIHPVTVIEVTLDTGDEPNVSSTTDDILREVRTLITEIMGPDLLSYTEDGKEVQDIIDSSRETIDFDLDSI